MPDPVIRADAHGRPVAEITGHKGACEYRFTLIEGRHGGRRTARCERDGEGGELVAYAVSVGPGDEWACSCPAATYRRRFGECKHAKGLRCYLAVRDAFQGVTG